VNELADSDVRFFQADLADVDAARAAVTATVALFGRIDCLCNAAGLSSRGTLLDTTPELFDQHIAVNLRAPFFAMQAAVKNMLDRKVPGSIVNIISIAAHGGAAVSVLVLGFQGGAGRVDAQRGLCTPLGPYPY